MYWDNCWVDFFTKSFFFKKTLLVCDLLSLFFTEFFYFNFFWKRVFFKKNFFFKKNKSKKIFLKMGIAENKHCFFSKTWVIQHNNFILFHVFTFKHTNFKTKKIFKKSSLKKLPFKKTEKVFFKKKKTLTKKLQICFC